MRLTSLPTLLMAAALAAGCAATPKAPETDGEAAATKAQFTGSRIAQEVDADTRFPRTASPLYVITREDIERTGEVDTAEALSHWPFFR